MHSVLLLNNEIMKSVFALICLSLITSMSFGQEGEWTLYSTVDGVEVYTMEADCFATNIPNQKAVIVKVVNTTAQDITVEWDKAIWYNDEPVNANSTDDEMHYTVNVKQNSTQEGSCDTPRGPFYIYKDFITYQTETKLTKFELQNITVTRL